jgi:hypothetical protein
MNVVRNGRSMHASFALVLVVCVVGCLSAPVISLPGLGSLEGVTLANGVSGYLGVPYAATPQRFSAPQVCVSGVHFDRCVSCPVQPVQAWSGGALAATSVMSPCPQVIRTGYNATLIPASVNENCLFVRFSHESDYKSALTCGYDYCS